MEELKEVRVDRILVAVDGSEPSVKATKLAVSIAKSMGARLAFISIVELSDIPTLIGEAESPPGEDHAQMSLGMAKKMAIASGVDAEVVLRKGHPASQIVRFADEFKPDIIVLGSRGRSGTAGILLGSVSTNVLKSTKHAVLIVQ